MTEQTGHEVKTGVQEDNTITLPCKIGDTVYFTDMVDCYQCVHVEICPGSSAGMTAPKPVNESLCPQVVEEQVVYSIQYVCDDEGAAWIINDIYNFDDPTDINKSREEAEKELGQQAEKRTGDPRLC